MNKLREPVDQYGKKKNYQVLSSNILIACVCDCLSGSQNCLVLGDFMAKA